VTFPAFAIEAHNAASTTSGSVARAAEASSAVCTRNWPPTVAAVTSRAASSSTLRTARVSHAAMGRSATAVTPNAGTAGPASDA
jgi:hypothetical protein